LYVFALLAKELMQQPRKVESWALESQADVFTREQAIGEGIGLRRIFLELDELFEKFRRVGGGLPTAN
jgi:hypothetical protein